MHLSYRPARSSIETPLPGATSSETREKAEPAASRKKSDRSEGLAAWKRSSSSDTRRSKMAESVLVRAGRAPAGAPFSPSSSSVMRSRSSWTSVCSRRNAARSRSRTAEPAARSTSRRSSAKRAETKASVRDDLRREVVVRARVRDPAAERPALLVQHDRFRRRRAEVDPHEALHAAHSRPPRLEHLEVTLEPVLEVRRRRSSAGPRGPTRGTRRGCPSASRPRAGS